MIAMTIPLMTAETGRTAEEWEWGTDPDLWMYRARTVALLRKYARLSVEVGRIPSLLGREFFRTQVTSYHMSTFEDVVIFVHDVERSLEKLDRFEQKLIAKIVLLEYTQERKRHGRERVRAQCGHGGAAAADCESRWEQGVRYGEEHQRCVDEDDQCDGDAIPVRDDWIVSRGRSAGEQRRG
jgi:hypothetical protein